MGDLLRRDPLSTASLLVRRRIKTGNYGPGLRPVPVAVAPSCQRFLSGPTWAGPELHKITKKLRKAKVFYVELHGRPSNSPPGSMKSSDATSTGIDLHSFITKQVPEQYGIFVGACETSTVDRFGIGLGRARGSAIRHLGLAFDEDGFEVLRVVFGIVQRNANIHHQQVLGLGVRARAPSAETAKHVVSLLARQHLAEIKEKLIIDTEMSRCTPLSVASDDRLRDCLRILLAAAAATTIFSK